MRLSIALGALAGGLGLGWAAMAAADAPPPPAAPIFYCPSAPGAKPAPTPAAPAGKGCPSAAHAAPAAPAARVEHPHAEARHEPRYAQGRWVAREAPPPRYARAAPREDVSASQAFIYRYERAQHGLDARAADQAWAHADAPPPNDRDDRRFHEREYAEAARPAPPVVAPLPPPPPPPPQHVFVQPAPPPPVVVEVGPTPPARVYVERMAPLPPPPPVYVPACPDRCPRAEDHEAWREHHEDAEAAPPAYSHHEEHYGYVNAPPAYAEREESRVGQTYSYERRETEHASSWRSSDGHGYAEHREERRGPCPPSPDHGCSAASPDGRWQDGSYGAVYRYSGRDAYGFLVWPGKN